MADAGDDLTKLFGSNKDILAEFLPAFVRAYGGVNAVAEDLANTAKGTNSDQTKVKCIGLAVMAGKAAAELKKNDTEGDSELDDDEINEEIARLTSRDTGPGPAAREEGDEGGTVHPEVPNP